MHINKQHQLVELRSKRNIQFLEINADEFLAGDLLLYLFRYAAWALAEGGCAEVTASKTVDSMGILMARWSFQSVLQSAVKGIANIASLVSVDLKCRKFTFQRYSKPLIRDNPWSAAVMFSGKESEIPYLKKCIEGLQFQPELTNGGQILICGPTRSAEIIKNFNNIEYLPFDDEIISGRFMVGRKKNYAVSKLNHEKLLVCHTRIILQPGCLAALPDEFDLITPAVNIVGAKGITLPYADLMFHKFLSSSIYTQSPGPYIGYQRVRWRNYLREYQPYIDGALFCSRRSLFQEIQISGNIAWGEGEDVEWCRRLLLSGYLIELCENATAKSVVNKTKHYYRWGHMPFYGEASKLKAYFSSILSHVIN